MPSPPLPDDDDGDKNQDAEGILTGYLAALPPSVSLTGEDEGLLRSFLRTLCEGPDTPVPIPTLLTTSLPRTYHAGTGRSQTEYLARAIKRARHEVIFVTCFWAASDSLAILSAALRELSARALAGSRRIRVRICFSSVSAWQKVRQSFPPGGGGRKGRVRRTWECLEELGLPGRGEVRGLDVVVWSLFFPPFSVLHGKYCVVDRRSVFIGSGNVSWECWGEGCGGFGGGGFVSSVLAYYRAVWGDYGEVPGLAEDDDDGEEDREGEEEDALKEIKEYPTILLPNPHHPNPNFPIRSSIRSLTSLLLPCLPIPQQQQQQPHSPQPPPNTPQNAFLLTLLSHAKTSITIHTPNLTSKPLLASLLSAASRKLRITIITCRNMMRLEQLATTPFSTTESCVRAFVASLPGVENVHLGYWRGGGEVRQWHVKALIVDDAWTVIGSANGDRASWWGSGEINVCVFGRGYARDVGGRLERWAVEAGGVEWVLGGRELAA
ncbi:unnamed protein product [Tuber aestivum]|uniref:PLD phosphodiesterase domain-containing protein n=1 Tax=Tuber aestivum TaxID=59557 RepID=A0A292PQG4_9PEZI|nr:unnamed protein product [Tuber aestivum]